MRWRKLTRTPLCVVSLDVQEAFDRISHTYLSAIPRSYGLSKWFVNRIRTMHGKAHSSAQVYGHIAGPVPIRCCIRQRCPLSMVLVWISIEAAVLQ